MYNSDVWRAVVMLTKNFGMGAESFASERVDATYSAGDQVGCVLWMGVTKAIEDFLSPSQRPGETMH